MKKLYLSFIFFIVLNGLNAQYIQTGPGIAYAFHSVLPMYSMHAGIGFDMFKNKITLAANFQVGIAEGNRNFNDDGVSSYLIYSMHHENPLDGFGGRLIPRDAFIFGKVKTSMTTQFSSTVVCRYNYFSKNNFKIASGLGLFRARVNKQFIFEEHPGMLQHNIFFGNQIIDVVYLEPYYYNFSVVNAYLDTNIEYKFTNRVSCYLTLYYQHMNRFRGLLGIHSGIQVRL